MPFVNGIMRYDSIKPIENAVFVGDCLDIMHIFPDDSINLILFSPPYNQGRGEVGGFATGGYDKWDDQIPERTYRKGMMKRIENMVRLLKPSGSMFIVIGQRAINRKLRWPLWITDVKGLKLNSVIIRRFKNSPQIKPVRFFYRHEPIFWLYKKWPPRFHKEFAEEGDVWHIEPEPHHRHPAVMPTLLVRKIIRAVTKPGDVVFDPFNGIGTTCLIAKEMSRRYIGCDISEEYCQIARHRLNQSKKQLTMEDY